MSYAALSRAHRFGRCAWWSMSVLAAGLLPGGCALSGTLRPDGPPEPLQTVAERSAFKETSRLADVKAFLDSLAARSPRVHLAELGRTTEDRPIPLAIIADPPVKTAAEALQSKKLIVLLVGGIHSGECDGKEALLALARELALGPAGDGKDPSPLLKDLIVAIVPDYNADGNEHIGPLAKLRPGQIGPDPVGTRENARNLDLNRDFVKLEAPETRALVSFINEWDPAVVLDAHTTNGSLHRYLLTYDGPKNPAGDAAVIEYARDTFLPAVGAKAKEAGNVDTFWYGNFEQNHARWETYPDQPRYGINYVGLRNRLSILTESYSYAPYAERIRAQEVFIRVCLERTAADHDRIAKLIDAADRRAESDRPGETPIRSKMVAADAKVKVLGFDEVEKDGHRVAGEPHDYDVDLFTRFAPEKSVARPYAYVYPASLTSVTEVLLRHGIRIEETREDLELDCTTYSVEGVAKALRPFQGHELLTVQSTPKEHSTKFPAGSMIVKSAQPLGALAIYILEPDSNDGLATWNFLDAELKSGEPYPIARLEKSTGIATVPVPPLSATKESPKPITFEAVYESDRAPNLNGSPTGGVTWLEDGEHYLQTRDGMPRKVDAATGKSEPLYDAQAVADALRKVPTIDRRAADSIARRGGLRMNKSRTAAFFDHENDLYYVKLDGSDAARLTSTPQREEMPTFSPDGKFVAFIRDNDLWVVDVATSTERALTTGGTDRLRNGKNDWVYFEEVFNRSWEAYWWSPDSSRIAYLQIDDAPVKTFAIVNDPARGDLKVENTPYPKPGDPNPRVKLFTVAAAGGDPREVDLSAYSADDLVITGVGWWPDSSRVYAYVCDRVQSWLDIVRAPAGGGESEKFLHETTKAWVDNPPPLKFLKDGSFLLMSERTGWKHIYRYSSAGKLFGALTEGEWEARSIAQVDEDGGRLFVSGTLDSPIAENLYVIPLEGGKPTRLTKGDGSHRADVSPKGKYFVDSWSSIKQPPKSSLYDAKDGSLVRTLDTNPVRDLARYRFADTQLLQIKTPDGFALEASITRPVDCDPGRKYPVWFMTYAGPHAPVVSNSWGNGRIWDQVLASAGFVVFHCDPRSASGKGAISAWTAYKRLGVPELEDIETAIRWIGSQPYVDASRIGMSGHSYGGFMTSYCLTHSTLFAAGIAGAPVTDWRDYDSIYTERYMLTPQDNPEGYKATSVVGGAAKLHGQLLILHGLIDDNVHFENTSRLVRALQSAGKQFEMMVFPDSRHGIGGRHYQRLMYNFITRTLGSDATPPPKDSPPAPSGGPDRGRGTRAGAGGRARSGRE